MSAELAWTLGLLCGLAGGFAAVRLNSVTFKEYDRMIDGWRNLHDEALKSLCQAWAIAKTAEDSSRFMAKGLTEAEYKMRLARGAELRLRTAIQQIEQKAQGSPDKVRCLLALEHIQKLASEALTNK